MPRRFWPLFNNPKIIEHGFHEKSDRAKETHIGARTATFSLRLDIRSGTRSHACKCGVTAIMRLIGRCATQTGTGTGCIFAAQGYVQTPRRASNLGPEDVSAIIKASMISAQAHFDNG